MLQISKARQFWGCQRKAGVLGTDCCVEVWVSRTEPSLRSVRKRQVLNLLWFYMFNSNFFGGGLMFLQPVIAWKVRGTCTKLCRQFCSREHWYLLFNRNVYCSLSTSTTKWTHCLRQDSRCLSLGPVSCLPLSENVEAWKNKASHEGTASRLRLPNTHIFPGYPHLPVAWERAISTKLDPLSIRPTCIINGTVSALPPAFRTRTFISGNV